LKSGYLVHVFAAITLLLGVYIAVTRVGTDTADLTANKPEPTTRQDSSPGPSAQSLAPSNVDDGGDYITQPGRDAEFQLSAAQSETNTTSSDINPKLIISDYIAAWQNRSIHEIDRLWKTIAGCDKCLQELVDLIINHKLEEGLDLEVAIKMAALDSDIVLPVFDVMIDPAGSKSAAIILSEKLMNNGRPEFVNKIFDLIYRARISGYDHFAQQLTWVISKLENPEGIQPILDTITGRKATSPELSQHVTNVYSRVVGILPEESNAATVIADYYLQANSQEQQRLWPVVSQHGKTLVTLALDADKNGQNYDMQKYATAMTKLPHLESVESLMQLQSSVEYSPAYLSTMLSERVIDNPTSKVLQKLEDYMRNPKIRLESRIFAAEGLLSVKQNRQARYILEKVINNTEEPDAELQAYIGGRL